MKKRLIAIMMITAAVALCACGKKESVSDQQSETTIARDGVGQTETTETTEAATIDTEAEEFYLAGIVTDMGDGRITVEGEEDGKSYSFGLSLAEREENDGLLPTTYVEVSYNGDYKEGMPATSVYVLNDIETQASNNNTDPVLTGIVDSVDQNDLLVIDLNGVERYFNSGMVRTISFGDSIEPGTEVQVTYYGSLDEAAQTSEDMVLGAPIALKIVSRDAYGSEEAQKQYIEGIVNNIRGTELLLDTPLDTFEFDADEEMLKGFAEGDSVRVSYTGSFGERNIEASKIEKK